jgi:tetratricopeptide (TPR) repeat protein
MTLGSSGSSAGDQVRRASLLIDLGRHDEAEPLLRRVLATCPDDAAALRTLARALGRAGRFAEMLQVAEQLTAQTPEDYQGHRYRAKALIGQGDAAAAVSAAREAIRLAPGVAVPYPILWHALMLTRNFDEALEAAQQYSRLRAGVGAGQTMIALANVQRNQIEQADGASIQALAAEPGFVHVRLTRALVQAKLGRLDILRTEILSVLQLSPDQDTLEVAEGLIRYLGKPAELADVYEMILAATK